MERIRVCTLALLALAGGVGALFAVNGVLVQGRSDVTAVETDLLDPPLADTRLTVHTLLREDIFAGFMANDMKRFARGEKNIEKLMEMRPAQKANLQAWKGGALLFRAVLSHEDHRGDEFKRNYEQALDLLSQAGELKTGNDGVSAITGGSNVIFADRLPKANQAAAWTQAYDAYQAIWKQQGAVIQSFPVHFRGEVLAGLSMSAERTGHTVESEQHLDKMHTMLRDTPYEAAAKAWKENPKAASNSSLACLSCHEPGRLAARLTALDKK